MTALITQTGAGWGLATVGVLILAVIAVAAACRAARWITDRITPPSRHPDAPPSPIPGLPPVRGHRR